MSNHNRISGKKNKLLTITICLILMVIFLGSLAYASSLVGDVNEDGVVNGKDALSLQKYLAGTKVLSEQGLKNADVNADGVVNSEDGTMLNQYLAGEIDSFPLGTYIPVDYILLNKYSTTLKKGSSEKLVATVYPINASNKDIIWSTSNKNVVSVETSGKITAKSKGTATIVAMTSNGEQSARCTVTVKIEDTLGDVNEDGTVNGKDLTLLQEYISGSKSLSGQGKINSDVNADGKVDSDDVLVLNQFLSGMYTSLPHDAIISVIGVSLNKSQITLEKGNSDSIKATIIPSNATNKKVSWSSSNKDIATVDSNGKIKAISKGSTTITVTTDDRNIKATCKITVTEPVIEEPVIEEPIIQEPSVISVTGVTLSKTNLSLEKGNSEVLKATVKPADATNKKVTWSSSNSNIVTVDSSGKVTAKGKGTAIITVTTNDRNKKATCTVTVTEPVVEPSTIPVTGVKLSKTELTLKVGKSETLEATIEPKDATIQDVSWISSNKKVATVSAKGKITAKSKGETIITVITDDGDKKATCFVTVEDDSQSSTEVTDITLSETSIVLYKNNSKTLKATVSPSNAKNKKVKWSSSDTNVATVNTQGYVTAKNKGTAIITATTVDGGLQATCEVTVNVKTTGVSLSKKSLKLVHGDEAVLTATVWPKDATNQNVTWKSSKESVATVDANGKVTAVGVGTATITVTTEEGNKKATCTVNVEKKKVTGVTLSNTEMSLVKGESGTLVANIIPADATEKEIKWESSKPGIVSVDQNGNIRANSQGTAKITVTTKDGKFKATCNVTVNLDHFDYDGKDLQFKPMMDSNHYYTDEQWDEIEKELFRRIEKAGVGTRAAVVEAALYMVSLDYAIPYKGSPISGKDLLGKYPLKGVNKTWGRPVKLTETIINPTTKKPFEKIDYINGLDCSAFVTWLLVNANVLEEGTAPKYAQAYMWVWSKDPWPSEMRTKTAINKGILEPGDLIGHEATKAKDGYDGVKHVALVVDVDSENIYVAEENGTRLQIRKVKISSVSDSIDYYDVVKHLDKVYYGGRGNIPVVNWSTY